MEKIAKPGASLRQPSGRHQIQPDASRLHRLRKYGFEAQASLRTVVPGQLRNPVVFLSSSEGGPIEAYDVRRACHQVARRLMKAITACGLGQYRKYVLQLKVWRY